MDNFDRALKKIVAWIVFGVLALLVVSAWWHDDMHESLTGASSSSSSYGSGGSGGGVPTFVWVILGAGALFVYFKWVHPHVRTANATRQAGMAHDQHHTSLMEKQAAIDEANWQVRQAVDDARDRATREGQAEVARVQAKIAPMNGRWV